MAGPSPGGADGCYSIYSKIKEGIMKKQTAVDYLVNQLNEIGFHTILIENVIKQAKEMEKEQIMDAYYNGKYNNVSRDTAEQYYNETYESKTNL